LLSKPTTAVELVSAKPKFVAGFVTQPCTSDVTSKATNEPAVDTVTVCAAAPSVGKVW